MFTCKIGTNGFQTSSRTRCFFRSSSTGTKAYGAMQNLVVNELESIKKAGTWKSERVITSAQSVGITVEGKKGTMLNFCANNYLGLANNEQLKTAGKTAIDKYGCGLASVRFICGTQNIHKDLEQKISKFHHRPDTILYPSCFDANAGFFEVLLNDKDAVISDELNHASIIDGIRLCKAKKYRYKHRDMAELENHLKSASEARMRLIVTDGVFSMDGTVAPLPEICDLANRYDALVFLDESHATGIFGKTGRGTEEYYDMIGSAHVINSTLGKAMGGASGGYTTSSSEIVQLLRQRSRPYLFSNSVAPPVVAASTTAMELLMSSNELVERLHKNTKHFRNLMSKAGFTISGTDHPIAPVMIGDAKLAGIFADEMLVKGIYVIGFSYPVVPLGKARIRVQISAGHTSQDIDKAVDAFIEIGKKLEVLPK